MCMNYFDLLPNHVLDSIINELVVNCHCCSSFLAIACANRYFHKFIEDSESAWFELYKYQASNNGDIIHNPNLLTVKQYVRNTSSHINKKIMYTKWCIDQGIKTEFVNESRCFQLISCHDKVITQQCFINCFAKAIDADIHSFYKSLKTKAKTKELCDENTIILPTTEFCMHVCPVCEKNKHENDKVSLHRYKKQGLAQSIMSRLFSMTFSKKH